MVEGRHIPWCSQAVNLSSVWERGWERMCVIEKSCTENYKKIKFNISSVCWEQVGDRVKKAWFGKGEKLSHRKPDLG